MTENVGIIVTARVKSSRIPEKVLQKIDGKYSIEILLDHLINKHYPVILAIPQNSDDNKLEDIALERGIDVYRGYDDSPLHRLYNCAKAHGFDHVVRVTADDILIDFQVLRNQIKMHCGRQRDYTFCRRIPEGCAAEVINVDALKKVIKEVGDKPVEFVSYYLKKKDFNVFEYYPHEDFQHSFRLVMDHPADLTLLRILFASMRNPGTLDIINFLKKHTYFTMINHLPTVTVYTCNYNTSEYIEKTMRSVLNQTYADFEYIIIDDNSEDNSMNVITEFYTNCLPGNKNKIKILRNDRNIGLPATCNKVLEMTRGKFIVRVDSDDTIEPNFIQTMIDEIYISEAHGAISAYNRIDENDNIIETINEKSWHPGCALLATWVCNELKYKEDLQYLEGRDFFNRFKKQYKMHNVDNVLWNYRKRDGQKTQQPSHPDNIKSL